MSNQTNDREDGWRVKLITEAGELRTSVVDGWRAIGVDIRNGIRRMRKERLDYLVLPVGGSMPELDAPHRRFPMSWLPLPDRPLSMAWLHDRLRAVTDADNVRGIIFVFTGFSAGLATLQNFRTAVARLRAAGKEAIVYTPYLDLAHYYAATAADRIIAPPGARFDVLGLYTEITFLKDALTRAGLEVDVVQISPYKTAYDRFSQSDITPEHREQLDRLLDDQFDMLTAGMAADRGLSQDEIKPLIDRAPFSVEEAHRLGLIDHVAYEDELRTLLGRQMRPAPANDPAASSGKGNEAGASRGTRQPEARLMTWKGARRVLIQRTRRQERRFIGVVSLEGMITTGTSKKPPIALPIPLIGGESAGDQTIVGQLRRAEKMPNIAALIFHVDSGGGSALASDLIARQIELLAAKMPVVIYMGNVAASGGYYVAAPASHIMSQEATITGSIGVISARFSSGGLYERLSANRVTLERGEHAGLYRDTSPWTEAERAIFQQTIVEIYDQFRGIVGKNRGMTTDEVDEIGLGRVWTGRQALSRRLVDSHGDFLDAIKKAAELAALPIDDLYAIPVLVLSSRDPGYTLPATGHSQVSEELTRLLSGEQLRSLNGRPLLLLPYDLRLR